MAEKKDKIDNEEEPARKINKHSFNMEKIASSPVPIVDPNKKKSRINIERYMVEIPLTEEDIEPLWVSVTEAAKFGGVQGKTIRRAIQADLVKYRVVNDRYQIDFGSVIKYLHTSTKLKNKINNDGVGKYIDKWKE